MKFIKRGLRKTVSSIKQHKFLFILLIVLQIAFILSLSFVVIKYQVKILEDTIGIITPLEGINYDSQALENGVAPINSDCSVERYWANGIRFSLRYFAGTTSNFSTNDLSIARKSAVVIQYFSVFLPVSVFISTGYDA